MSFDQKLFEKIGEQLIQIKSQKTDIGVLQADLNDLVEASNDYLKQMEQFLQENNKEGMLNILIDIQITMEHFKFHIDSALPFLKQLINSPQSK